MSKSLRDLTAVFDLDGTLIDSAPDLIEATNHVLETEGYGRVTPEFLRPYISYGTRVMLAESLSHQGHEIGGGRLDQMFDRLIAYYGANIAVHSRPFPGLEAALEGLSARGVTLAICTNKLEPMARQLMGELRLDHHFKVITGRDTFPVSKPNPDHLLGAIRLAGGEPSASIMVGDSTTDYATAKAAGVPIIGVTFGYTDVPMADLECEGLISHYSDFISVFEGIASGSS